MRRATRLTAISAALVTALLPTALAANAAPVHSGGKHHKTHHAKPYKAEITRTAGGVAHIKARDFGSLGYGYGYSFASDDICALAKDLVTLEGKRSYYFGPQKTYTNNANSVTVSNLDSDVYWRGVRAQHVVQHALAVKHGPGRITPTVRSLMKGYVAGYNGYLAHVGGAKGITDPACHAKPWVRPMTVTDEYLRLDQATELSSAGVVMQGIAEAKPPAGGGAGRSDRQSRPTRRQGRRLARRLARAGLGSSAAASAGSNAIAVGKAGTRDQTHGLLLGNPHFPWAGTERFYQVQLTVPGKMNVEGGSLYGLPLVMIGHTENLAWSHTDDTPYKFVPMRLTLAKNHPTSYVVDGKTHKMSSVKVSVPTRSAGHGKTRTVHHTLWSTRYGPVFDNLEGQGLPWTTTNAYALFDANAGNTRVLNHFLHVDEAQSVAQLKHILDKYEALPWVNTIASDRSGHALYADIASVPDVSDAKAKRCDVGLGLATFPAVGLPVLDGAKSSCAPTKEKGAAAPGIFPPDKLPLLQRSDYVTNSNDSYWLANPAHPLTGFARILGDTGTPRSLRTRSGLVMTQARIAGTDGQGPAGFTRQDMQRLMMSDVQYGATLVLPQVVDMCNSFSGSAPESDGSTIPVGDSCSVLANWDGHENVDSVGAVLFRAFWEKALSLNSSDLWQNQFDPSNPVTTPNGLDASDSKVQDAFGDALQLLTDEHLAYDVPLGKVQYVVRHGKHIAIPGGPGDPDGDFNAIAENVFDKARRGDPPPFGSSYIQVVTWHSSAGCPDTRTLLTYSQSANPHSRWYADQTRLFSARKWNHEYFCARAVAKNAISTKTLKHRR